MISEVHLNLAMLLHMLRVSYHLFVKVLAISLCFLGGLSLQYNPSERVAVAMYFDVTHGKPQFDYVTYVPPNWTQIEGTQDITLIGFGGQLTYIIGN